MKDHIMLNSHKALKIILFGIAAFALWACSASETPRTAGDIAALPVLPLRVTTDIDMPETMVKAGFIPKAVKTEGSNFTLNLPGQIVTLADTGSLWFTTTEGEDPLLVSVGPFTDFYPLAQDNGDSVIIALKDDGAVSAFVQPSGAERFDSLPVSSTEAGLKTFCAGNSTDAMHVVDQSHNLHAFSAVRSTDNQVVEITVGEAQKTNGNVLACRTDPDGNVYAKTRNKNAALWHYIKDGKSEAVQDITNMSNPSPIAPNTFMGLDTATGTPLLSLPNGMHKAPIEDGLSIRGTDTAEFMAHTPASMGTVFGDGLYVLSDPDENRLILMSAGFVNRAIENASNP